MALLLAVVAACEGPDSYVGSQSWETDELPANALHFLALGDWGRNGGEYQRAVADEMGDLIVEHPASFVISTGDNFYPDGVQSIHDPQWRRSFEEVYTQPGLQIPWYVVLGNHDYEGNEEAQVAFSRTDERWRMPERYFTHEVMVDDSTEALFVFLDTTPIARGGAPGAVRRQLEWVDSSLAASDAAWRLVVGHHPLYAADDKHGDNTEVIRALRPILESHRVQAYISGHAHSLQHLKPEGGIHYFISGAGSRVSDVVDKRSAEYATGTPGFLSAFLTSHTLYVRLIDHEGAILHAARVSRWLRE